jgi:2-dehydropantoate 2-reductase
VIVCGRTELDRLVVSDESGTHEQSVKWVGVPDELPPVRWALLATKIQDTPAVADWLCRLPADGGVLVAQNGVDHRERVSAFTAAHVVPALVYISCERVGPGHVHSRHTSGGLIVPDDVGGRAVAELYEGTALSVQTKPDFLSASWEKLLFNVVGNSLSVLTGRRMEMLGDPAVRALAIDLAEETAAVARAAGIGLSREQSHSIVAWMGTIAPESPSSMLQDRWAGRPLEHEGLLAPVVALADRHGVPTPVMQTILRLLRALAGLDKTSPPRS